MRKLTEDFIGTCQACLGQYKVGPKTHLITLHGYQRPGYGYVIGRCQGTDNLPFEYDKAITEKILIATHDDAENLRNKVRMINEGKAKRLPNPVYKPETKRDRWYDENTPEYIFPDDPQFPHLLNRLRMKLERDITYLDMTIEHYEMLIRTWVHQKIIGIDSPPTGRKIELRDGYDPKKVEEKIALDAKRAERAARPGKLFLSIFVALPYPTGELSERHAAIEEMYEKEKEIKTSIKLWARGKFPNGKTWVGDIDSYLVERHHRDLRNDKIVGATVKPDWSYADIIVQEYDQYVVVNTPKEIRLIIPASVILDA